MNYKKIVDLFFKNLVLGIVLKKVLAMILE
jgi:hypothetical protein